MTPPVKSILLIDDDCDDCELFSYALSEVYPSLHLHCINDAREVLTTLALQTYDLIFMDINMPGKDGFECLTELKEKVAFQNIPIVMYSSTGLPNHIAQAYGYGAALFFKKPSTIGLLVMGLKRILELNWLRPAEVTASHFVGGRYHCFEVV